MNKLPAFQFYPADWRKDPAVQSLSYHDRGVWFEILCLLHESEQRGKLILNGQAMPEAALSRLLGLDKQVLSNTINTLLSYGVASRCEVTGALMSRRMVRDEAKRSKCAEAGKKGGGNPTFKGVLKGDDKGIDKGPPKRNANPSSSSSISTSLNDLCKRAREMTCSFFGISEIKNPRMFMEITGALELIDQKERLGYYIQQLEAYQKFKTESGQQACNVVTWIWGEIPEERHVDNGHWSREDYQTKLKNIPNNATKTNRTTPAIASGTGRKNFGKVEL